MTTFVYNLTPIISYNDHCVQCHTYKLPLFPRGFALLDCSMFSMCFPSTIDLFSSSTKPSSSSQDSSWAGAFFSDLKVPAKKGGCQVTNAMSHRMPGFCWCVGLTNAVSHRMPGSYWCAWSHKCLVSQNARLLLVCVGLTNAVSHRMPGSYWCVWSHKCCVSQNARLLLLYVA